METPQDIPSLHLSHAQHVIFTLPLHHPTIPNFNFFSILVQLVTPLNIINYSKLSNYTLIYGSIYGSEKYDCDIFAVNLFDFFFLNLET